MRLFCCRQFLVGEKPMQKASVPHFIKKVAKTAPSFKSLSEMALEELRALDGSAHMVCGPISTGGYGNAVVNLLVFNHAIEVLRARGCPVWSQMPYEAGIAELEQQWRKENPNAAYCESLLTEFYLPLVLSNLIAKAWFLDGKHGWETSRGASWEFEQFRKQGTDIALFPEEWHGG